jgi:hypothetical protein
MTANGCVASHAIEPRVATVGDELGFARQGQLVDGP